MNRIFLMGLLGLDLIVMLFSGYLIWDSVKKNISAKRSAPTAAVSSVTPQTPPAAQPEKEAGEKSPAILAPAETKVAAAPQVAPPARKKVVLQYRDLLSKQVSVTGDFNKWKSQPMSKGDDHLWTATLELPPGQYAYNFVVDGKMIRDPSNRKTKNIGLKIPSSLLVIETK